MQERYMKLGICKRCQRLRPIYQVAKQLCSSCRQLEKLYSNPKKYKEYLEKQRKKRQNPEYKEAKRQYNYDYYRTGDNAERMKEYGRKYWQEYGKYKYSKTNIKWAKEHPEQAKKAQKKYYDTHREKRLNSQKRWRNSKRGKEWKKEYMLNKSNQKLKGGQND